MGRGYDPGRSLSTILDQPAIVNNILIAQAGVGTNQIGRFDFVVDDATNSIVDWKWELIPINDKLVAPDKVLEDFIREYKYKVDEKYNAIITRFSEKLTHPKREEETTLGNLFADAMADMSETDIMLVGSGSIRVKELGPVVTLGELKASFPYDDSLTRFSITGKQLKEIFAHIMRVENRNGEGECYQINSKVKAVYSDAAGKLESITLEGKPVVDDHKYSITLQSYHVVNAVANLGISNEALMVMSGPKVVTTSAYQVLEEWLRQHPNVIKKIEGRLVFKA